MKAVERAMRRVEIPGRKPDYAGKVRDIYELGDSLLIVATDRVSAYDVVLEEGIPGKGRILTQISRFWFEKLKPLVPSHYIATDVASFPAPFSRHGALLEGCSMLVRRAKRYDVECVVRGYLAGSGWKEYQATGEVCGVKLQEQAAWLCPPFVLWPAPSAGWPRWHRQSIIRKTPSPSGRPATQRHCLPCDSSDPSAQYNSCLYL